MIFARLGSLVAAVALASLTLTRCAANELVPAQGPSALKGTGYVASPKGQAEAAASAGSTPLSPQLAHRIATATAIKTIE